MGSRRAGTLTGHAASRILAFSLACTIVYAINAAFLVAARPDLPPSDYIDRTFTETLNAFFLIPGFLLLLRDAMDRRSGMLMLLRYRSPKVWMTRQTLGLAGLAIGYSVGVFVLFRLLYLVFFHSTAWLSPAESAFLLASASSMYFSFGIVCLKEGALRADRVVGFVASMALVLIDYFLTVSRIGFGAYLPYLYVSPSVVQNIATLVSHAAKSVLLAIWAVISAKGADIMARGGREHEG